MSWGMSLNKMQVFNWTHYRKVVFMDSDTIAFQNLDHLFGPEYPTFTAALTFPCCNVRGPAGPSGGLWVFEPDVRLGVAAWELMVRGKRLLARDGTPELDERGAPKFGLWHLSDLDIITEMFTEPYTNLTFNRDRYFPFVNDKRHGLIPGLRRLPAYRHASEAEWREAITDPRTQTTEPEGFLGGAAAVTPGGLPVWRALDVRYDQCIGTCECLPGRDLRDEYISIHFR